MVFLFFLLMFSIWYGFTWYFYSKNIKLRMPRVLFNTVAMHVGLFLLTMNHYFETFRWVSIFFAKEPTYCYGNRCKPEGLITGVTIIISFLISWKIYLLFKKRQQKFIIKVEVAPKVIQIIPVEAENCVKALAVLREAGWQGPAHARAASKAEFRAACDDQVRTKCRIGESNITFPHILDS